MERWRTEGPNYVPTRLLRAEQEVKTTEQGLILMDLSLRTIAFDCGASAILNGANQQGVRPQPALNVPQEILEAIRGSSVADLTSVKIRFRTATGEYRCSTHVIQSQIESLPETMLALQLERDLSDHDVVHDAVSRVRSEYRLTGRERETLEGVAMGLSSKEIAARMNISPYTVRAFLRLIMIRLGVKTRAGIVAKLLDGNGNR